MDSHFLFYKSSMVHYLTCGKGEPLILIHGYQADSRIWTKIVELLKDKFRLIIPDLPGHGKSPLIQTTNTMEFLADIIFSIAMTCGYRGINIAGHSMGGYVGLAFAEKYPNMVDRLILINSHPFTDSITRLLARNREAELIIQGKKQMLLRSFVKNNFSKCNFSKIKAEIKNATEIALNQSDEGMLADLAGMMARTDKIKVIKKNRCPVEFIVCTDDAKMTIETMRELVSEKVKIREINNCGHLSIIEKPEKISRIIMTSQ